MKPFRAYLDNHSTTRPSSQVVELALPFYRDYWGSLSSPHQMGQELYPAIDKSLKIIYDVCGAEERDNFFLMSSGAEVISQILWSHYIESVRETGRNHFLTTAVEEATTLLAFNRIEKVGCLGKTLKVNTQGQLTKKLLEASIRPRDSLLSLSWAHGLTGVIQPIDEIAEVCREKEILFHIDVSSVMGKLFFRFQDLSCDFLSFEGEKIHGLKGSAGLFVKAGAVFSPMVFKEPSLNVPGVVSLSAALENSSNHFDHMATEIARLRNKFEEGVMKALPEAVVFFQGVERLPTTSVIAFPGAYSEALLFLLNRKGVYASSGGGNSQKLSEILQACQISRELSETALNFSLSYETTEADIDYALEQVISCVKKLQQIGGHP